MSDYEDGFYWVHVIATGERTVAEYERGVWWIVGSGDKWYEIHFSSIGPKLTPPSEETE